MATLLNKFTKLAVIILCAATLTTLNAQTCATPIPLTPGTQQCGDTSTGGDNFDNSCMAAYDNGDEYVFTYTVPMADNGKFLTLALTSSGSWTGITIAIGCGNSMICLASEDSAAGNETINEFVLTGGVTYTIVISTFATPQSVPFCLDATIVDAAMPLSPKVFLQGALSGASMTTDLGMNNMLPTTDPYNGTKTATMPVLMNMVDWVMVEIRDAATGGNILAAQPALLKPDGTIVDEDGTSALVFPIASGSYHVAVKHRNHLSVMTGSPVSL